MSGKKRTNESSGEPPIPRKMKQVISSPNDYITNGIEVIHIALVDFLDYKDIEVKTFNPLFVYQLLDMKEIIYGYKDLTINIRLTKTCLHPYIRIEYTEKLPEALDLNNTFDKLFNGKYETDIEKFKAKIKEDTLYVPSGKVISTFNLPNNEHFEIYKTQAATIKEISVNLQALMMLFIDGLSFIDNEPYWHYYLLYRVTERKEYTLIGYATTYESHQAIDKYRVRISQMLVIPTYQRKGFGAHILSSIYQDLRKDPFCFEITVEEPSDGFLAMRDLCSAKMLLNESQFSCFKKIKEEKKITASNIGKFNLTKEELESARKEFKLTKVEIERCFEMIKFAVLDKTDEEAVRQYRIAVKKRLFVMHKDSLLPDDRIKKIKEGKIENPIIIFDSSDEEVVTEELVEMPIEERKKILECYYNESIGWYTKLSEKILKLI